MSAHLGILPRVQVYSSVVENSREAIRVEPIIIETGNKHSALPAFYIRIDTSREKQYFYLMLPALMPRKLMKINKEQDA